MATPDNRILATSNPRNVRCYKAALYKYLHDHQWFQRMQNLRQELSSPIDSTQRRGVYIKQDQGVAEELEYAISTSQRRKVKGQQLVVQEDLRRVQEDPRLSDVERRAISQNHERHLRALKRENQRLLAEKQSHMAMVNDEEHRRYVSEYLRQITHVLNMVAVSFA